MIANLKALGLALIAVFAVSSVVASAASAQTGVFTTDGWATLTGTLTGEAKANSVTLGSFVVSCPNLVGTGTAVGSTTTGIPNNATSATITPNYGLCSTSGFPTTVAMNGCDYVVDAGATVGVDEYSGQLTTVCPAGQHIVWQIFTVGSSHIAANAFCEVETTGTSFSGPIAKDTTNNKIDITGTVENISVDVRRGADSSILPCPTSVKTATLHVDAQVEAAGTAIGLSHS